MCKDIKFPFGRYALPCPHWWVANIRMYGIVQRIVYRLHRTMSYMSRLHVNRRLYSDRLGVHGLFKVFSTWFVRGIIKKFRVWCIFFTFITFPNEPPWSY